jgi:hypothetical protein
VNKQTLRYAIAGCVAVMAAVVVYAFVRLYVLGERADISILVLNVGVFAGVAVVLIYLTKKQRDIEEAEFFSD